MSRLRVVALVSGLVVGLAGGAAWAQTAPETTPQQDPAPAQVEVQVQTPPPVTIEAPAPEPAVVPPPAPVVVNQEPVHVTVIQPAHPRNATLSVGGGVSNFFDQTMQNRTGIQGAYEARVGVGARSLIGLEAAYVGTAGKIDTLGLDDNAMLISNGVEGLARLNLGTGDVQPFIVGGGSWVRYNIINDSFNTSDIREEDDVFAVPVGAGVAAYLGDSGLMLDGRFVYRATFDDELVRPTAGNSDGANLNNWVATVRLGYTF